MLAHVLGSGAIERGVVSIDDLPNVALIILAAPVRQNIELLQQFSSGRRGPCQVRQIVQIIRLSSRTSVARSATSWPRRVRLPHPRRLSAAIHSAVESAAASPSRALICSPDAHGSSRRTAATLRKPSSGFLDS